ncbi:MAG: transglutaminase domain-containing protein [Elainellaceae cyanobacterium]
MPMVDLRHRTIRPFGSYALHGLSTDGDRLLALDAIRGYLIQIDTATDDTVILNPYHVADFIDGAGLSVWEDTIWFTKGHKVLWCTRAAPSPQHFVTLPYPANGVAVWQSTVYVTCQKAGYILIFDRQTGRRITRIPAPGIGVENLTIQGEDLWVSDTTEQTVYCMDRATGEIRFSALTPYPSPTGITFWNDSHTQQEICYVSYAYEEPYIRDDPNSEDPHQLTFRDRTFIHPLHFHYYEGDRYTLSNGYLVEMSYVEELSPLDELSLTNLEWRIALPAETPRQKIRWVEPVGMPFTEEFQNNQRIALFKFDQLKPNEGRIFGWRALVEVRSIKYCLTTHDLENAPQLPLDLQVRYLIDDDDLAMDSPVIQAAAKEAIGTETNLLRKALRIRNYVYDRLSYGIKPHIDTPDVALQRGIGSCGEYVGILLALLRLNNIACRTVGRYKCPPRPEQKDIPLEPDFNHVWIEFYVPGMGWVPMESNVDDIVDRGPYPNRFFMGLAWYHAEVSKGIPFEKIAAPDKPEEVSIGDLAINHIRFKILEELPPPE